MVEGAFRPMGRLVSTWRQAHSIILRPGIKSFASWEHLLKLRQNAFFHY